MDYGDMVSKAFNYARHSKAVLAYLGLAAVAAVIGGLLLLLAATTAGFNLTTFTANPGAAIGLVLLAVVFFALFFVSFVALDGVVIANSSAAGETLSQSFGRIKGRLLPFVGITLLVGVVGFLVSMFFVVLEDKAPALKGVFSALSILFSLALWVALGFVEYFFLLGGKGVFESFEQSIRLAREKPVEVALSLIVSALAALLLLLAGVVAFLAILLGALFVFGIMLGGISGAGLAAVPFVLIAALFGLAGLFAAQVVKINILTQAFGGLTGAKASGKVAEMKKIPASGASAAKASRSSASTAASRKAPAVKSAKPAAKTAPRKPARKGMH